MKFNVNIIYSSSKDIDYIGHTNDLEDRLDKHDNNRIKYTKGKVPWKLVVSYPCKSSSEDVQLEMKLKSFKNPEKAIAFLKKLIQSIPTY